MNPDNAARHSNTARAGSTQHPQSETPLPNTMAIQARASGTALLGQDTGDTVALLNKRWQEAEAACQKDPSTYIMSPHKSDGDSAYVKKPRMRMAQAIFLRELANITIDVARKVCLGIREGRSLAYFGCHVKATVEERSGYFCEFFKVVNSNVELKNLLSSQQDGLKRVYEVYQRAPDFTAVNYQWGDQDHDINNGLSVKKNYLGSTLFEVVAYENGDEVGYISILDNELNNSLKHYQNSDSNPPAELSERIAHYCKKHKSAMLGAFALNQISDAVLFPDDRKKFNLPKYMGPIAYCFMSKVHDERFTQALLDATSAILSRLVGDESFSKVRKDVDKSQAKQNFLNDYTAQSDVSVIGIEGVVSAAHIIGLISLFGLKDADGRYLSLRETISTTVEQRLIKLLAQQLRLATIGQSYTNDFKPFVEAKNYDPILIMDEGGTWHLSEFMKKVNDELKTGSNESAGLGCPMAMRQFHQIEYQEDSPVELLGKAIFDTTVALLETRGQQHLLDQRPAAPSV